MKLSLLWVLAASNLPVVAHAQVTDVPSGHWAAGAVKEVVAKGVMKAPGGTFGGGKNITRRELAITLANFAKSLEKGSWTAAGSTAVKQTYRDRTNTGNAAVTRYELAAVLSRVARHAAQGIPKPGPKVFGQTEAFPPKPAVNVPRTDPAHESINYLINRRMAFADSVVIKPGNQPVTPKELVVAVSWVLAGLSDQHTDEPQNREDLGPPPSHQHGPRPKAT